MDNIIGSTVCCNTRWRQLSEIVLLWTVQTYHKSAIEQLQQPKHAKHKLDDSSSSEPVAKQPKLACWLNVYLMINSHDVAVSCIIQQLPSTQQCYLVTKYVNTVCSVLKYY